MGPKDLVVIILQLDGKDTELSDKDVYNMKELDIQLVEQQ